jgi:hypothetical protein
LSLVDELEDMLVKEKCNKLSSLFNDEDLILKDYIERLKETQRRKKI